ncbi:hypothetical protein QVD17_34425 [Tagetes erecta]|uniref:Transmembrane protein n=1 Tax=Tagetes erecta TaxID=13708 RepID=A0AAD8JZF6_TARER|nr:hypothetical protein QVD17_34425 [Tagetes erecta]
MPFNWKKKKTIRCNRFSQLVADHLQSPKRGGSLVVETGFPTSLIDLYVRNRGRFRRSSAKKQRENDSVLDLNNLSSSSSSFSLVDLNDCGLDRRRVDEIVEEDVGGVEVCSEIEVETSVEMVKLNPVLVVLLKVLFMVVLILGTKGFTVAITVSAFMLLLIELAGKRLLGRSRGLRSSVGLGLKEDTNLVVCSGVLEIEEQGESKRDVRSVKEVDSNNLFESSFQETETIESSKELDEVKSDVSMEIRRKGSRREMMKSRMKKLVPKKLRKSSIVSKEEISCELVEEEERVKSVDDHEPLVFASECSDSKGATLRILKQNQDEIVEVEGRPLPLSLSSEMDCNGKELGTGLRKNSGCMILCLVVLVGLIGGRVLALVLALSWCLMLKKLQWRNVKFPIS